MSNNIFMEAADLYGKAMKTRDALEFSDALQLFHQAAELISQTEITLPFRIAFVYDTAIAYDLAQQHDKARLLFNQAVDLFEMLETNDPSNPSIAGFADLVWGIRDYLSLWENASESDEDYLKHLRQRAWGYEMMPLAVFIDPKHDTGFDTTLCEIISSGFKEWSGISPAFSFEITKDYNRARVEVTRLAGSLGSAGGQTDFEEHLDIFGYRHLSRASIQIALHSHHASAYQESELAALRSLAIHEAGHAFGLDGHSPHATDIMYWKSPLQKISQRDKNTFRLLYA